MAPVMTVHAPNNINNIFDDSINIRIQKQYKDLWVKYTTMDEPSLVEPATKYFIANALQKSHEIKMSRYSFIFNIIVGTIFFLVFGGFLFYRYKTKPTPLEMKMKMEHDQAIIMSKIHQYHDERKRASYSNITNLPFVDMDYYVSRA